MMQDKLNPSFRAKNSHSMKWGTRRVVDVTFNSTSIQSGQDLYIPLMKLPPNHVVVPGSRRVALTLTYGNQESYHQTNLKSTSFKRVTHKYNS